MTEINIILYLLKSEFKGQIVSKFDLDLLNAYNLCYRNISENKYGSEGSYLSCVTKGEFYFSRSIFFHMFVFPIILKIFPRKQFFRDGDKLQLDLVQ